MGQIQKEKRIAVLLAAYNGRPWIQKQVDSILSQQNANITLFVSVDKSTDGTEKWFDQLAENDSRVLVLPHGQKFGGAAPNFFRLIRDVDFGDFDFVSFADQDDIWYQDKLERALQQLKLQNADAYSSNVTAYWSSGKKQLVCKSQPQRKWDFLFEAAGPGCTYVIRKALMLKIKQCILSNKASMDSVGLHDWFSYAYARANGYKWYIDPWPSMLYYQHEGNQVGINAGLRAFIYRFFRVVQGWGIEQSVLIAQLVGLGNAEFVLMWSSFKRAGFWRLAYYANQCRRKKQDRIFFLCACLFMAVLGLKKK
jgi:rhamnosyltransferase